MAKFILLIFAAMVGGLAQASDFDTSIPSFLQVTPQLYRGGRPQPADLPFLASLGIKTIINLQGGDLDNPDLVTIVNWWEPGESADIIAREGELASDLQIGYFNFPLNSLAPVTPEEDAEIDQALAVMSNPANQPVYVHCERGIDRTGLLIALYRVLYQNWSVRDAFDEWRALGHGTLAYIFTGDLDDYFYRKVGEAAAVAALVNPPRAVALLIP